MQAAIQMFGVHKEAPVVQQKTTGRSLEDGWWWTLVRATGWDSSRNTGPGIGQGLAQPPPAASDSEWHNSHTHLDTAAHCLTTLDTLGHSTLPDHCWTHLERHTLERHLERHTLDTWRDTHRRDTWRDTHYTACMPAALLCHSTCWLSGGFLKHKDIV